ncbi:hypothetical protein DFJ73DRAFT_853291, partial [Zopfochytrium polystomum]
YEGMSGLVDCVARGTVTRPKTAFTAWTEGVAPDETPPAFYSEIYLCHSATASSLSVCATESAGCAWRWQHTAFQDDSGNVFVLCVNGGKVVGGHAAGGGACRLRDGCRRWTLSARRFGGRNGKEVYSKSAKRSCKLRFWTTKTPPTRFKTATRTHVGATMGVDTWREQLLWMYGSGVDGERGSYDGSTSLFNTALNENGRCKL